MHARGSLQADAYGDQVKSGTLVKVLFARESTNPGYIHTRRVPESLPRYPCENSLYESELKRIVIGSIRTVFNVCLYMSTSGDVHPNAQNHRRKCPAREPEHFHLVLIDGKHVWLSDHECTLVEV